MTRSTVSVTVSLGCMLTLLTAGLAAAPKTYTVDPRRSRATIEVGKSGVFSFVAGHTHEVVVEAITGDITFDAQEFARSSVRIAIDASRLMVSGKGEPPDDVPKVQATMAGEQVLDVRRHPKITFQSTRIALKRRADDKFDAIVDGRLTLHGVTRPLSVPLVVRAGADGLTATGRFPVKQTDFGIKPVSVGGVVSVKDTVNISFTIVGR